jgi:hypothetical protein
MITLLKHEVIRVGVVAQKTASQPPGPYILNPDLISTSLEQCLAHCWCAESTCQMDERSTSCSVSGYGKELRPWLASRFFHSTPSMTGHIT